MTKGSKQTSPEKGTAAPAAKGSGKPAGTTPNGTTSTGKKPTGTKPTGTKPTGTKPTGTKPTGKKAANRSAARPGATVARAQRRGGSPRATVLGVLVVVVFAGVILGLIVFGGSGRDTAAPPPQDASPAGQATLGAPVDPSLLIRDNSQRLSPPAGNKVRFVEFLDLECEACRAAFPTVERLRAEYAGRVDFVARYFPIPSHRSAEAAAFATEAAGRQGQWEPMYQKMYQTQSEWSEQQVSQDGVFRGFAGQLGLDLARFDRDVADPALRQRVLADRQDGTAAGVSGTPTIFINDRPVDGARNYPALKAAIDQALAAP